MKNIIIPNYSLPWYNPHMKCRTPLAEFGCGASFEIEDCDLYVVYDTVVVNCPNCKTQFRVYSYHPHQVFVKYVKRVIWENSFLYKIFNFVTKLFRKPNKEESL